MSDLLHHLLIKSAKQSHNKIAIKCKSEKISYGELNRITNQLALLLIRDGVKRNERVGIYLDKSIDSIIGIFGVLKAGAAYVPLDPVSPPDRIAYIIRDCAMQYLITSTNKIPFMKQMFQNGLPVRFILDLATPEPIKNSPVHSVNFKSLYDILRIGNPVNIETEAKNTDLAYIIYTSGSTGEPKGIMITHRNSLAFINWAYRCFRVTQKDRISNHAPLHFDLSIFDIFVSIKAGATICIIPQGTSAFPRSLAEFIEKEKITIWYSVPSTLIQLLLYGGLKNKDLSSLRLILFAGEVFPTKYLRLLIKMIPHAQFYNLYGPTETNVCTYHPIRSIPSDDKPVPIGKPCGNLGVFALDKENRLIKPGDVGELYVCGSTLMKGYWNDADKTEEVLIKIPLSSTRNKIAYRTGDLVTIDNYGNYIFIGRHDNMIKSRGYRIELEEIEAILYTNPEIKEAAAVAVPDEEVGNKIKAVVVPSRLGTLSKEKIKAFCSQRMPKYMMPEIIEFRTHLPRTTTGKIDRQKIFI